MPGLLDFLSTANDPLKLRGLQDARLAEMKRNRELAADPRMHMMAGATNSDVEDLQSDMDTDPLMGVEAHKATKAIQDAQAEQAMFNTPEATAMRAAQQKDKLAGLLAVPQMQGENALAVEKEKNRGALALGAQENEAINARNAAAMGGHAAGQSSDAIGSWQPKGMNAKGEVTYEVNKMPALIQRSAQQLQEARDQVRNGFAELERNYPGIADASLEADKGKTSWLGGFFGMGPKYGSGKDSADMQNEYLKYIGGRPTPYAKMFQSTSFGNISQMAGQLPGVRGLATIAPLFKEHQAKYGNGEAPLAMAQRMQHMIDIIDQTLERLNSGTVQPEDVVFGEGK